jgi:hypothetical protein
MLANHQPRESLNGKIGPDPRENSIQTASALHAFAGENAMSVFEVATTLDTAHAKIVELERKLSTQQDDISVEFHRAAGIAEKLYKEEMERSLTDSKG